MQAPCAESAEALEAMAGRHRGQSFKGSGSPGEIAGGSPGNRLSPLAQALDSSSNANPMATVASGALLHERALVQVARRGASREGDEPLHGGRRTRRSSARGSEGGSEARRASGSSVRHEGRVWVGGGTGSTDGKKRGQIRGECWTCAGQMRLMAGYSMERTLSDSASSAPWSSPVTRHAPKRTSKSFNIRRKADSGLLEKWF